MSTVPLPAYLTLALVLFCIGLYGALTKRNMIMVLVSIELMLNAVNINLIAFSKLGPAPAIFVMLAVNVKLACCVLAIVPVIAVAAVEAAVGLAILFALYRNRKTVNIDEMNKLNHSS